jgi:hypothetical protein
MITRNNVVQVPSFTGPWVAENFRDSSNTFPDKSEYPDGPTLSIQMFYRILVKKCEKGLIRANTIPRVNHAKHRILAIPLDFSDAPN